ncbi:MAG: helix-turn-helix domain-containing protein [Endozoicomonas sp.]
MGRWCPQGRRGQSSMNPTPQQIKKVRQDAGLSQQKAAELLGVSLRTWGYWEAGEYRMRSQSWRLFNILLEKDDG